MTITRTFGREHYGVILDGTLGQDFNNERLVRLAIEYGYEPSWLPDDPESIYDETLYALDYLNDECCDPGYTLEWQDGDLRLVEHREYSVASVSVESEMLGHVDYDSEAIDADGIVNLQCVRVAFPDTENGIEAPRAFDWLNSLSVVFEANDGHESVQIYTSTGDPRGALLAATLTRREDGTVMLTGPASSSVKSHEHYAQAVEFASEPHAWKLR